MAMALHSLHQPAMHGQFGTGVELTAVTRARDAFVAMRQQEGQSDQGRLNQLRDYLSRIHATDDAVSEPHERLTPREREVLQLAAEGHSTRAIAGLLCLSTKTVEHHRASLMTKLGLHGQTELVKYAIRAGLVA